MSGAQRWQALLQRIDTCADAAATRALLQRLANADRPLVVAFVNAHAANLAWTDPGFAADLLAADILLRDGIGMSLLMRACGHAPGLNLNGTDFIPELMAVLPRTRAVAVLGTEEPWLSGGKDWLSAEGYAHLYAAHGFHPVDWYEQQPAVMQADILLLAMGMPKQEQVAIRLRRQLAGRPALILNGGAIIDFRAGRFPRAPLWLRQLRLEWAYRLLREPRRLWRRYVLGNVLFLLRTTWLALAARPGAGR